MGYGFCVRMRGPMALFTRPECKAERVTYEAITPTAARGALESVYWHPGLRYVIDRITVLNPIRYDSIRRNEVGAVAGAGNIRQAMNGKPYHIDVTAERQQRASVILRDVDYLVDAHFVLVKDKLGERDDEKEFYNILLRRLRNGQHYAQPYLGTREFAGELSLVEGERPKSCYTDEAERDLGFMLLDVEYGETTATPRFFHAVMRGGEIEVSA